MTNKNAINWNKINSKSMILVFGNMLEFYDLSVYGLLATTIAPLFFPNTDVMNAYILSFGVFAVAYVARPIGATVIGYIADKFGRKKALITSILLMSFATGGIAVLPTFETLGILAPLTLILLRLLQGISTGGEFPSSCIYLLEQNKNYRGFLSSLAVASGIVGMLFGSIMCYLLTFLQTNWAWRIPFVIGMFIGLISTFIRRNLIETAEIDPSTDTTQDNPLLGTIMHFKTGLITIFITAFPNILFYTTFFYYDILIKKYQNIDIAGYNSLYLLAFVLLSITFGYLSNRISIKKIMSVSSLLCFLFILPIFISINTNHLLLIILLKLGLVIFVASYMSVQHGLLIDLWPKRFRCSGISIYFSIGGAALGGTAPMVLLLLTQLTGIYYIAAFYLMLFSFLAFASIRFVLNKQALVQRSYDNISQMA